MIHDVSPLSFEMDNSHHSLPLNFSLAAMFPRQSGFRGLTPLLPLLIHGRLQTWTQTQLHIVTLDSVWVANEKLLPSYPPPV